MWFHRQRKNRRNKRDFVLEVRTSSRAARRGRWRMAATALMVSAGTLLALFLFWRGGRWALDELVFKNEAFAIRIIEAKSDGSFSPEQLRKWSRVKLGDNLLALDLSQVKRELQMVPLIRDAAVERVLPQTLRLRVTEREPFAQINALRARTGENGYEIVVHYLDEDGYVMPPLAHWLPAGSPAPAPESLPILAGVNHADLHVGRTVESPSIYAALRLMVAFERSPMFGLDSLERIDVSSPDVLQVTTTRGSQVVLGVDQVEWQLRRWRRVYDEATASHKAIGTLDLSVTNNAPLRWLEAEAAPVLPPKALKTLRIRKHHV
jgi:cell division septal protein FtsQ